MKKILILIITLFMLLTSFSISTALIENNDNIIFVKYEFSNPKIIQKNINNIVYDYIILDEASCSGSTGEPLLPIKGAYILLPPNEVVHDIEIKTGLEIKLGHDYNIQPVPKTVQRSNLNSLDNIKPKKSVYESENVFPENFFYKTGTYTFRGYTILVLELYPIRYIPSTGELFYYPDLLVTIETEKIDNVEPLFRNSKIDELEIIKKVDNPDIINLYKKDHTIKSNYLDDYDMLILTKDELQESFQPLKEFHDSNGLRTSIKSLEDVLVLSSDNATSEDIRDYIRNEYKNNNIEYVLLGGDSEIVPAKMLWVSGMDEEQWYRETEMPSDLYYGCLDGTFNYDNDEFWGEPTDGENGEDIDLYAEVFVGRACVDNAEEVDNFVDKTISYLNTNPNDEYLKEYLFAGEYLGDYGVASWGGNYLDTLIDESTLDGYSTIGIPSDNYNIDKLYDRDLPDNYWPKEKIMEIIDNGTHIINHDGHAYYGYNLRMTNNDVEYLSNDKPCFIYSVGCMSGGFDNPDGYDCIAEYFNVKTDNGAFAVIMNARYGWFWSYSTDGDGTRFTREFWDAVFNEKIPVISKANQDSKEDNLHIITRSCIRWTYYQLNLFGDPSISFHVSQPPAKPVTPNGTNNGKIDESYSYSTFSIDPDGDDIYYMFSWGDSTFSDWIGPLVSGETAEGNHLWPSRGSYEIRVKARDSNGVESEWSDPLTLSISKVKDHSNLYQIYIQRFFNQLPILKQIIMNLLSI